MGTAPFSFAQGEPLACLNSANDNALPTRLVLSLVDGNGQGEKLVARGGRKDLFEYFTESSFAIAGLVVLVGIGVWIVYRIRSRFADDEGSVTGDHGLFTQISDLHAKGDLTEEEYRSIKGRLVERIDDPKSPLEEEQPAQQTSQFEEWQHSKNSEPEDRSSSTGDMSNG